MKRLLITCKEFREQQTKHNIMTKEESKAMANKVFPTFMEYINSSLISQTGTGVIFKLSQIIDEIELDKIASMPYNYDAFEEELMSLLSKQFEVIDDFKCTLDGEIFSIIAIN